MKQNTQQTQKISVFKFTFWFPVLYSCITAVLMMLALAIVFSPSVSNEAAARAVLQAAAVSLAISPSALIFNFFLGTKHSKRYMYLSIHQNILTNKYVKLVISKKKRSMKKPNNISPN